jgi:hypothetical protein
MSQSNTTKEATGQTGMSAPVDVRAVLDLAFRHLNGGGDSLSAEEFRQAHAGMKEARAAIAELIEADKEYDAAKRAIAETDPQSEDAETMEAMRAHRNRCVARRATAIVRCGGAS